MHDSKPAEVLVTGSVAWDNIMSFGGRFTDHILPEKLATLNVSFLVERMERRRGGCAANIAHSLALHGLKPRLVAAVGPDFEEYRAWLEARGIDTSATRVFDDVLTASCFITTDAGNNQITGFFPGAMARARDVTLRDAGGSPFMAIVSPNDPHAMRSYPAECRELGLAFVYDPGQQVIALDRAALEDGLEGARVVIMNEYEHDVVRKKTGRSPADMLELADAIVVTLGEKGSRVFARGARAPVDVPIVKLEKPADPTGAGDAYRGGLVRGLASRLDWEACARLGALTASFCIEGGGTSYYTFARDVFARRYGEAFGARCPV